MDKRLTINRWLAVGFVILVGCCWVPPIVNYLNDDSRKDYPLWYATGQLVMHGEQVYPEAGTFPFMYPPVAAIILAPLTCAGELPMVLALVAINTLAWTSAILLSIYLVTGRVRDQHPLLYLLPTLCSGAFAFDVFHLGQPNLLLLTLLLGALACLNAGREWGAGALVAVAAGIKAFPLMAVGYLVYRRHWKAVVSLIATLVLLFGVIPVVVRGPNQGVEDVTVWTRGMLLNYNSGAIGQRTERAYSWKNQSLIGLTNRFLRHKLADEDPESNYYVNVVDLGFKATNAITLGIALGLCICYITVMPRSAARTPLTNAIEFAMLLLLILLFSPYSFGYYFVWLLFPYAVLCYLCLQAQPGSGRQRGLCLSLVAAILLMMISLVDQRRVETYGNFFFATLVLFGALGYQLWGMKQQKTREAEELPSASMTLQLSSLFARRRLSRS